MLEIWEVRWGGAFESKCACLFSCASLWRLSLGFCFVLDGNRRERCTVYEVWDSISI